MGGTIPWGWGGGGPGTCNAHPYIPYIYPMGLRMQKNAMDSSSKRCCLKKDRQMFGESPHTHPKTGGPFFLIKNSIDIGWIFCLVPFSPQRAGVKLDTAHWKPVSGVDLWRKDAGKGLTRLVGPDPSLKFVFLI